MTPEEIARALRTEPGPVLELLAALPEGPADWRALAAALACARPFEPDCRVLGLGGGQGAGKSTLAALVAAAYTRQGQRTIVLSLDDFYLTRAEREALAAKESPLFATRGVPGTHDVERLRGCLRQLLEPGAVRLPRFDKGADDRLPEQERVTGPFDLVVLEGWCVGCVPQPAAALEEPVNALEAEEDGDGRWRRAVNAVLAGPYRALFEQLDALVYLAVPDLDAVRRWRGQQEQARPPAQRMSSEAVARFVSYYERLTRWMLATLPETADVLAGLDANHRLERLVRTPA